MPFLNKLNFNIARIQTDRQISRKGVNISVLRLDQIHPVISGNKIFKLLGYLDNVIHSDEKTLLTYGGAYSNHLHATALACSDLGIKSIGIIRGSEKEMTSGTLEECRDMGMELSFVDRETFRKVSETGLPNEVTQKFGNCVIVPAGGFGQTGAASASFIFDFIPVNTYSHICTAVGTGTTLAGLLLKQRPEKILAFLALKGLNDLIERIKFLDVKNFDQLSVITDYHFGGFAKKTTELIDFMNFFYSEYEIPLDFVYTGKMMFGIFDLIDKGYFPVGANIMAIHSGGLQGNRTLPAGTLVY